MVNDTIIRSTQCIILKIVGFHPGHSCAEQAYTWHSYVHWKLLEVQILRKRYLIWCKYSERNHFTPLLCAVLSVCYCLRNPLPVCVFVSIFLCMNILFRAMCQICRLITDAAALPTYCIIIAYYVRTQSYRKIRLHIQMIA